MGVAALLGGWVRGSQGDSLRRNHLSILSRVSITECFLPGHSPPPEFCIKIRGGSVRVRGQEVP